MKKILSLIVVVFIFLAGCNSDSKNTEEVGGEKTLKMWVHVSDDTLEGKAYKQRAEAFNEAFEGEMEVQVEYIARGGGGTGYEDKINGALTTNTLPDVITLDGPNTAAYAESGIILDLSDYISDEVKDDFIDTALEQGIYQEGFYSLAIQESTVIVYYNQDMFVEAGICESVDSCEEDLGFTIDDPWTFEEFKEIGAKLQAHFQKPAIDLHLGSHDEWITYGLAPFIWTSGGSLVGEDGFEVDGHFNSEGTIKGFQFIKDLVDSGISTATPEENAFEIGTYPMSLSGAWTIPDLKYTYADTVENWGVLPYPVGETGELHAASGSWAFGVTKSTDMPEEASKLVEWMTNTESAELITTSTGLLPARESSLNELDRFNQAPDKLLMDQLLAGGHPRPSSIAYPEISFAFQQVVDRVISGQSVEEAVNQLTQQLEVKLQRHKR